MRAVPMGKVRFLGWGANPPLSFPPSPPLALEEGHISPLSFHPVLSPFPSLISRPLKSSYGVWGSAVSSVGGVWGGAPAEKEFGAF